MFKIGGIPKKLRPVLESEGIVVSDEGLGGWFITRNFKAPGKRSLCGKKGISGCLVVTKKRVLFIFGRQQINIPVGDPKMSFLYAKLVKPQTITLSFESAMFHSDWQGIIELQLGTEKAQEFYDVLVALGVQQSSAADADKRHR